MAQPAEQLVGRAAEVGLLDRALDELRERRSGAIEVVGEPGIGKTRLLAELGAHADAQGQLVLSGSASELERELPFWVFVDALDEYIQALEPRRTDAIGEETLGELAHVFPSLPAPRADDGGSRDDERYRTHRAVSRLLEVLAATKPLVLLLDDLHWADSGSIELLGSLLRRPPDAPVLMALAMRPRQVPARLFSALERARGDGALTTIELGALSADEARELLRASGDGAATNELYEQSGGNPFYLEQLARSPQPSGPARSRAAGVSLAGVEVPPAVAAALTAELALLPEDGRRVLEGAAVAGDPFEPELAAAAAGMAETPAMESLDELVRRDLVRPTEVPRRFRFRHPLVRGAVYEAAPAGWRLGAHERSAAALAERGASAGERAHHVERSARSGDLAAVAVLSEAGDAAVARTPASATRLYEAALRLLPAAAPVEQRVRLVDKLVAAQIAVGLLSEPYTVLVESVELRRDDPLEARVRLTAVLASLENLLGRHEEAHRRLTAALEDLPDGASGEASALLLELAIDAFYRGEYESMAAFGERAVDAAAQLGIRSVSAGATGLLALGQVLSGAVAEAEASCARGAELVDAMPDEEVSRSRRATNNLAPAELYLGRYEQAEAHAERALAVAQATGQGQFLPTIFWTGVIRTARGRLPEAAELLDTAVEIARLSGHAQGLAWNFGGRSLVATAAGDVETALATAEEGAEALRGMIKSFPSVWVGLALAEARVHAGDPGGAAEAFLDAAGGAELPLVPAVWMPGAHELLARCRLAQGAREKAERAAASARAAAEALGLPMAAALADRATAAVALDAGDAQTAADRALASAAAATEAGAPVEAALARMLAGRAFAAGGDRDRALAELEAAATEFEGCGALGRRDEVDRELGKLGRRRHRRTRPGRPDAAGIESLTERELEVARLVVDRKTNAQIAAELFLSPKTVESHIRHLFQKLEVSSRVDVARVVERAERRHP